MKYEPPPCEPGPDYEPLPDEPSPSALKIEGTVDHPISVCAVTADVLVLLCIASLFLGIIQRDKYTVIFSLSTWFLLFCCFSRCFSDNSRIEKYLETYNRNKKKFSSTEEALAKVGLYVQYTINSNVKAEIEVKCTHQETTSSTDADGNWQTEEHTVTKFRHTYDFTLVVSSVDNTPFSRNDVNCLNYHHAQTRGLAFDSYMHIDVDDDLRTYLENWRLHLKKGNSHRDKKCDATVNVKCDVVHNQMVPIDIDRFNCFMTIPTYWLFTIFGCRWLYEFIVDGDISTCELRFSKRASIVVPTAPAHSPRNTALAYSPRPAGGETLPMRLPSRRYDYNS
jgi:hypothetical protein